MLPIPGSWHVPNPQIHGSTTPRSQESDGEDQNGDSDVPRAGATAERATKSRQSSPIPSAGQPHGFQGSGIRGVPLSAAWGHGLAVSPRPGSSGSVAEGRKPTQCCRVEEGDGEAPSCPSGEETGFGGPQRPSGAREPRGSGAPTPDLICSSFVPAGRGFGVVAGGESGSPELWDICGVMKSREFPSSPWFLESMSAAAPHPECLPGHAGLPQDPPGILGKG